VGGRSYRSSPATLLLTPGCCPGLPPAPASPSTGRFPGRRPKSIRSVSRIPTASSGDATTCSLPTPFLKLIRGEIRDNVLNPAWFDVDMVFRPYSGRTDGSGAG
jgi:hypothetical protein